MHCCVIILNKEVPSGLWAANLPYCHPSWLPHLHMILEKNRVVRHSELNPEWLTELNLDTELNFEF